MDCSLIMQLKEFVINHLVCLHDISLIFSYFILGPCNFKAMTKCKS